MNCVLLRDIIQLSKGKKLEETSDRSASRYIQIEDLTSDLTLKFTFQPGVDVNPDDLIIAWDGANAGKVGTGMRGVIGSTLARMRIINEEVDSKYLFRFLDSKFDLIKSRRTGATIPHVSSTALLNLIVPIPPLRTQKNIVAILDKADSFRQKDKQLLELYDKLWLSIFYDMFGENGELESKYEKIPLSSIADIASGVTLNAKNVKPEWDSYPYLRVFNVQDGFFDLSEIKSVKASRAEYEKYVLKEKDILLTEGGDPDKLGRGTIWKNEIENCIHQNHIFRVRISSKDFNPIFVNSLLGSSYGKKYFLKAAKQTTGIASINSTQLKAFPVLKPDLKLQDKFANLIEKSRTARDHVKLNVGKSDNLFRSLLQKAFNGELVKESKPIMHQMSNTNY